MKRSLSVLLTLLAITTAMAAEPIRRDPASKAKETHMLQPMPDATFWDIIDGVARVTGEPDDRLDALEKALNTLSLDDIISFEMTFRRLLNDAYTWDLWGAAYVIHGGCSDDGFEYFRRWLVSRGRKAYEAALANPDSLADLALEPTGPEGYWEFEEFYYVSVKVFKEKGGDGDPRDHAALEAGLGGPGPAGKEFTDDDEHLKKRYPKLWKRFGEAPLPLN